MHDALRLVTGQFSGAVFCLGGRVYRNAETIDHRQRITRQNDGANDVLSRAMRPICLLGRGGDRGPLG